ncbi:NIPSNAP family protein [uncultured Sneathiella sp.]|uniref:NIPSNAP family protein n=1 Tax=uncultured Sneathiella sp. TaxID=879315 RepID=UPI0030DA0408
MIVEERIYTIHPGKMSDFLDLYAEEGLQIISPILGNLIGYFTTDIGDLNKAVHLWGYDSYAEREKRRASLNSHRAWLEFGGKILPYIAHMENRILVPTSFSPIK